MLREWTIRRGVLLVFLLLPAIAVTIGHVLRLTTLPLATFAVFVSFVPFTAWVSYHKDDDPVRHLHRYAAYAFLPLALTGVVLAATGHWRFSAVLGAELTAEPVGGWTALAPGMVLVGVTALALAMGYYVLFERYTLVNAAVYFGVLFGLAGIAGAFSVTTLVVFVCVVVGAAGAPRVALSR